MWMAITSGQRMTLSWCSGESAYVTAQTSTQYVGDETVSQPLSDARATFSAPHLFLTALEVKGCGENVTFARKRIRCRMGSCQVTWFFCTLSGRAEDVSCRDTNRLQLAQKATDVFTGNSGGMGMWDTCLFFFSAWLYYPDGMSQTLAGGRSPVSSAVKGLLCWRVPCSVCSLSLTHFVDKRLRSAVEVSVISVLHVFSRLWSCPERPQLTRPAQHDGFLFICFVTLWVSGTFWTFHYACMIPVISFSAFITFSVTVCLLVLIFQDIFLSNKVKRHPPTTDICLVPCP